MKRDKNTICFQLDEEKLNNLDEAFSKLGLNADEEFEKWVDRFIKYKKNNNSISLINIAEDNKVDDLVLRKKIDKWLEKKNSVPFYLIKAFFETGIATGKAIERYSTKKGEMRKKFCTYNEKFTSEVFDRNLKLMCTNSKTGYGRFFRIRRDRTDESDSELTLFCNVGNYIDRYITSKKSEFIE